MTGKPLICVIAGPTASGKTAMAIDCALRLNAEIISADSRQVYRRLSIGTAKPGQELLARIPHHFIDHVDPDDTYTAGRFFREASALIHRLALAGRQVVVAGGSGLYVRALIDGIFTGVSGDVAVRRQLEIELDTAGRPALYRELQDRDPASAAAIAASNTHRLLRALEVCRVTGRPYSELRRERMPPVEHEAFIAGLRWPRAELYERINRRVEDMIQRGFLEEVRELIRSGIDPACSAMNTVGYKEAVRFLKGDIGYDDMIILMKQHTRNFAKRQLTWYNKESRMRWYDVVEESQLPAAAGSLVRDFLALQRNRKIIN